MWYSIRKGKNFREKSEEGFQIKCVESNDLINWLPKQNLDLNVNLNLKNQDKMVAYPNVILINNTLHMLYNGNDFGKFGIEYATAVL